MLSKYSGLNMDHPCAKCGRKRGDHKAATLHCPTSRSQFTDFSPTQTFEPKPGWKNKKQKFLIKSHQL